MGKYKGFKFTNTRKMKEGVGEVDYEKKKVRIHKKRARKRKEIGVSIYHEKLHIDHPRMYEKTIYKKEKKFKGLSEKSKQKLYNLL